MSAIVFMIMFFTILDFGRALYYYDMLAQAARIGTRYATVNTTVATDCSNVSNGTSSCETATTNYMLTKMSGITPGSLTVTYTWEGASNTCTATANPGCYVKIQLSYPFKFVFLPFPSRTLVSASQVVISQ